jgi:hypothetical protein
MDEAEYMLTTVDNPYSPVTQFNEWRNWDETKKYYTLSYLARITKTSHELSDADQAVALNQAMDEIVYENNKLYKKVLVPPSSGEQ